MARYFCPLLMYAAALLLATPTTAFSTQAPPLIARTATDATVTAPSRLPRIASTKLHMVIPPVTPWVIGHMVGGALGAPVVAATTKKGGWYAKIELPAWTPPNQIFAPVWTALYALMGVAVGRVYLLPRTTQSQFALLAWTVHAVLNLMWAPLFFGFQRLRLGMVVNATMWTTLVAAVLPAFWRVNPVSAYLLLPYLGWLTFATRLNQVICQLNPTTREGYNNAKFQVQLAQLQRDAAKYAGV